MITVRTASPACAEFIAAFEGGQSADGLFHPYWDKYGSVWTIGYGHTRGVGPNTRPLTKTQAEDLLWRDLNDHYAPIVVATGVPLNQHQFDALVSFVYNCGGLWLRPGHIIGDALHRRDWRAAADALLQFDHDIHGAVLAGLRTRREAERQLFLSVVPTLRMPWLTTTERRWCLEYDLLQPSRRNARRRRVLRRAMFTEAARIQHAAQAGGWDHANRRHRYHSLTVRCT